MGRDETDVSVRRSLFAWQEPPACTVKKTASDSRARDFDVVKSLRAGRAEIGHGAFGAVVAQRAGNERLPRIGERESAFDEVSAVGEARAEDHIFPQRLTGNGRDFEVKCGRGIVWDKSGGELELIRLSVAVGIERGGGERVVL